MADLLELSKRFIDEGTIRPQSDLNRPTTELSEVADGVAMIEAFSHVVTFRSDAGLTLFDVSLAPFGPAIVSSLRGWSDDPVHTVVYTHGHVDHVGGMGAIVEDAASRGDARPNVIGHANIDARFARYDKTAGYNASINARQFGGGGGGSALDRQGSSGSDGSTDTGATLGWPTSWVHPTLTYDERMGLRVGDLALELRHDKGETDDHTWAWVPEHKAVVTGDFLCWIFPNAGNPQKVQRYPEEWAHALRSMAALEPELLLPAHGLPIGGRERIAMVLDDVASALESLVSQTVALMNDGAPLDRVIHEVALPERLRDLPYLQPVYDEPEFVVRNTWRLYGGWYDGNPARLHPAPDATIAAEVASLAGGVSVLATRAAAVAADGDLRLAGQLIEWAVAADPEDLEAHGIRGDIYTQRRRAASSLMAKGIYGDAARTSARRTAAE